MTNCNHKELNVAPTSDTAWGFGAEYNVTCDVCKELVLEDASKEEMEKLVNDSDATIKSGMKYL